jgi:hypothetical protein
MPILFISLVLHIQKKIILFSGITLIYQWLAVLALDSMSMWEVDAYTFYVQEPGEIVQEASKVRLMPLYVQEAG